MTDEAPRRGFRYWLPKGMGILIAAVGLLLAAGGLWLLFLGGSPYYLVAGVVMIAAGALLFLRRPLGVWLYIGLFVATLVWALWEAGLDGWALVPRLLGPGLLLVLVLAMLPLLRGGERRLWLAPVAGAAAVMAIFLVAGFAGEGHTTYAAQVRQAQQITLPQPTIQGISVGRDWPAYGGSWASKRFSPLAQITPDNVSKLERVWTYHTGDLPSEDAKGKYSPETTPIEIGENLYLCSAKNIIISLDSATGRERWRFDPGVSDDAIPHAAACRGVSYYRVPGADRLQPCAERIIEATLDARLIAVDAHTGLPCPNFGTQGQVNMRVGLGETVPGFYASTSPPVIVRGTAVITAQVLDNQKRDAPSGVIRGYDAVTGDLRWAWDMGQPELTGVPPAGETYTRGTPNSWTIATGDEQLGLVYMPMGNSAVDYYGAQRSPVENFFATSLVALNATTGRPAWRFQTVHYDVWDYDLGSQGTLVDLPALGGAIPALVLPGKTGDIFVLDRRTGKPLHGVEERPVPIGGVEPQNLSRTQPFSLYNTVRQPPILERDMWGMSPIDQLWCRIQYRQAAYDGYFQPPTHDRHWIQYPGYNGGMDWGGISIDPMRGVIITNYNDTPNYNRLISREEAIRRGMVPVDEPGGNPNVEGNPQEGVPYGIEVNAGWRVDFTKLLCKEPPYGGIRAIDLMSGRTLWDRPLGKALRNGPFGIPSMLPIRIGTPNNGGPLLTASGLTFVAATTDNLIRAIDTHTGRTLWEDKLPAGGQSTPITYEADGWQYVVIMPGGHALMETGVSDQLIAYRLPSQAMRQSGASQNPGADSPQVTQ